MKHRITFHWVFVKSICVSSVFIGILFALFSMMGPHFAKPPGVVQWISYFLSYMPIGFISNLVYEEIAHKEQYYFYYNQGIGRIELWVVSILFSASFYVIFNLIATVCRYIWK